MAQSRMMAKNTFTKGLIMDFAPDNVLPDYLTNALNATMLTYNGNEMSLLNDMGNGRVETAFLPEGYIPMGTCEFGGIIYIVSYNPLDNLCLIGSFPSPERNITKNDKASDLLKPTSLTNELFQEIDKEEITGEIKSLVSKVIIKEDSLNPGDKYIIESNRPEYTSLDIKNLTGLDGTDTAKKLKLSIVAIEDSGKITKLETQTYLVKTEVEDTKAYFNILNLGDIGTVSGTDIDSYRNMVSLNYNVFSSKIPGKLAILAELEVIGSFSCGHRIITTTDEQKNKTIYDLYLDYSWEAEDSSITPKYITITDFEWNVLKKFEIDKNLLEEYELPYLIYRNAGLPEESYFYHTISSIKPDDEEYYNYNYLGSWFNKDHVKCIQLQSSSKNSAGNFDTVDLILGKTIGDILLNNNLGISNTVYVCSIETPYYNKQKLELFRLPYLLKYSVTPAMSFGLLRHLTVTNEIDFSKIGTRIILPTGIKYFASSDILTLNIDSEIYEESNRKVTSMALEFYDLNGFCGSYIIENRESYSGNAVINIPFNSPFLKKYKFEDRNKINKDGENTEEQFHYVMADANKIIDSAELEKYKSISEGDCGILFSNMLYAVKLKYEYSYLDPITQQVKSTENGPEIITKGFWLYTNGQFNDLYCQIDDFTAIKNTIPLKFAYKLTDKTSKQNVRLSNDTIQKFDSLLNATETDILDYNLNKEKNPLTVLADYKGTINLELSLGLELGTIYNLIENSNDSNIKINLKLYSPYSSEKAFSIIELTDSLNKNEENSEESEETVSYLEYNDYNDENKNFYFTETLNNEKYISKLIDKKYKLSTSIEVDIPELQFKVIPTEYKKDIVDTNILTPILYKTSDEKSYNYDDIGGTIMFKLALTYRGSDDSSEGGASSASDDIWYHTSIVEETLTTTDHLLYQYPGGVLNTKLVEGVEELTNYYNCLGNRLPFTLFTIQIPEPRIDGGYWKRWVHNIYADGNSITNRALTDSQYIFNRDYVEDLSGKNSRHKHLNYDYDVKYDCTPKYNKIRALADTLNTFAPKITDRAYLPAFITSRIANGGFEVNMASEGGGVADYTMNYSSLSGNAITRIFYPNYVKVMKLLLTINPDLKGCEIGTFQYNEEDCKDLQLISVITALLDDNLENLLTAKDKVAINGMKFENYLDFVLKYINAEETLLSKSDSNVTIEFDLSEVGGKNEKGEAQEAVITYINYNMPHDHNLIEKLLDYKNLTVLKYINGFLDLNSQFHDLENTSNDILVSDYTKLYKRLYTRKLYQEIDNTKFYILKLDSNYENAEVLQVSGRTHKTNENGEILPTANYKQSFILTISNALDKAFYGSSVCYISELNPIFYNSSMAIDDFMWDVSNDKHHFLFINSLALTLVDPKFSYELDDDGGSQEGWKIARRYYIGPSFKALDNSVIYQQTNDGDSDPYN